MNLENYWLNQLQIIAMNELITKDEKEERSEMIAENLEWIARVKKFAEDQYDVNSGIDKISWIEGFVVGFAYAAKMTEQSDYGTIKE